MKNLTKKTYIHKLLSTITLILLPATGFSCETDECEKTFSRQETNRNISNCLPKPPILWVDETDSVIQCLQKEYAVSDAILNKRYFSLVSILNDIIKVEPGKRSEMRLRTLKQAQRQWVTFRDKECDFITESEKANKGGTVSRYMCLIDQTYERANKLSEHINCDGPFHFLCPLGVG